MNKLNPFLDDGVLRVGGRLSKASICYNAKHPVILPNNHHLSDLMIVQHHHQVGHSGMGHTWTSLRQKFWIIKGGAAVRKVIGNCVFCRKRNTSLGQQIMAELPEVRVRPNKLPFSAIGVDYLGPFLVKQGRSMVKRFGCIFTCLRTRAVHIEVARTLSTDSFIDALQRFIGRRGKPEIVYSDNGTNFVGAERVLREEL